MRSVSAAFALALALLPIAASADAPDLPAIVRAADAYRNPNAHLRTMYRAALLNTSEQTVLAPDGTAYVKTGDIPAEWLRDASAQVRPYLFFARDPAVASLVRGIIAREGRYLAIDPYANAFRVDYRVWERKFELDSLAYPIVLAWTYWKTTGDASIFTSEYARGLAAALATMERERDHVHASSYSHKELHDDAGRPGPNPSAYTGMIWTGFRASDDPCKYNYLIADEMMAVVALGDLAEIERVAYHDLRTAARAQGLRAQVRTGIEAFGVVYMPPYGYVYAYEVDGLGRATTMDDANIPSLLSAPYFGYVRADDPIYLATRRFILSRDDPYFYVGSVARGVGSAHTSDGYVWPLALIMQGLTTKSETQTQDVLEQLLRSDPGDHLLHESFDPNEPRRYSRKDFGWPNALFSEFVMTRLDGVPPLPVADPRDLEFRP